MRSLRFVLATAFLFGCGATQVSDDDASPADSGKDGSVVTDSGKMDGGKDANGDATTDGGSDASSDADLDGTITDVVVVDATPDVSIGDGGFDPTLLSGLSLWLEASKGVTKNNQNQVSKWADQSGKANDATQATSSMQPVWTSSVINGLPVLHFNQANTQILDIADAQSLQFGTGDFLIEVVSRFDNDASNNEFGLFYGKVGQSSGIFFVANDAQNNAAGLTAAIDGNNFITYSGNYSDNVARSYGFRRNGSTLELRANGAQVTSQAQQGSVDVSASGTGVVIGDYNGGDLPLNGDIAEVVAVKGSVSSQDLAALEAYFKAKYNL